MNMFTHSRSSLENHIRFQTKMGKVYTRFQTKTAQNHYLVRRYIPYMAYRKEELSNGRGSVFIHNLFINE